MRNFLPSRFQRHMTREPFSTRILSMRRRCFVLSLLACGLFPAQTFAQKLRYAYTPLDVPGSQADKCY